MISLGANVHLCNGTGLTPLHIAAKRRLKYAVPELLAAGASRACRAAADCSSSTLQADPELKCYAGMIPAECETPLPRRFRPPPPLKPCAAAATATRARTRPRR